MIYRGKNTVVAADTLCFDSDHFVFDGGARFANVGRKIFFKDQGGSSEKPNFGNSR